MSGSRREPGTTLTWPGDRSLSPRARPALCGPGAPFERTSQDVLGARTEVFRNRAPHLREVLARAAKAMPGRPFLVFDGAGREEYTFADVHALAAGYAKVLAAGHGIGKGDRVAIASPNTLEYILTYWATVSLGAILVGLNGWWTAAEMEYGLRLTEPAVAFGSGPPYDRLASTAPVRSGAVRSVPLDVLHAEAVKLADAPGELPSAGIDEDDPAAILFTSGTTGRPKGATISHRNIVHFSLVTALNGAAASLATSGTTGTRGTTGRYRQTPPDAQRAAICTGPLFHVSGSCVVLGVAPAFGLKLVFPRPGRWDPETALRLTERHQVTQWSGVPAHYWKMLGHRDFAAFRTDQVATVASGGATFAPELMRLLKDRMPGVHISNGYGMTETMGLGTLLNGALADQHPGSVGPAVPTMSVQVRDGDGTVLPDGEVGEICIKGAGVFLGYWRDPDATAAALAPDRWYRTGDYGRVRDGLLYLETRIRDLIVRGGENIYPIEIEYRLVEHPDVADACVIGVPHRILGQEVKAFIVTAPGRNLSREDIRTWAAVTLAPFKVPAHVEFVDSLPYNETGKVIKRLLE
jgi:acyl-CoA synthetase (AMP-forming)/AMP-acid ligase II